MTPERKALWDSLPKEEKRVRQDIKRLMDDIYYSKESLQLEKLQAPKKKLDFKNLIVSCQLQRIREHKRLIKALRKQIAMDVIALHNSAYEYYTCPICGQKFHLKPSALKKLKLKACCSKECNRKYRSLYMSGSGNHQYGLKGDKNASFKGQEIVRKNNHQYDIMVYQPEHPYANKNGRVKKHRLIVELNYRKFDCKYFALIDGRYYLKKQYVIHHIDGNHDNNDLGNLKIVTVMEHRHLHNLMSPQPKSRTTGRFVKQTERGTGGFGSTGTR